MRWTMTRRVATLFTQAQVVTGSWPFQQGLIVDWAVKVEIDSFVLGRGRQRVDAEGRNVVTK